MKKYCKNCDINNHNEYGSINQICVTCSKGYNNWTPKL